MPYEPPPIDPRRPFTKAQQYEILMRQSFVGADDVRIAQCEVCVAHIARLDEVGVWRKLRPFDFDHVLARGLFGDTSAKNGRAICSGPEACHAIKTAHDMKRISKADSQGLRTGQQARRAARKAKGLGPLIKGRRGW